MRDGKQIQMQGFRKIYTLELFLRLCNVRFTCIRADIGLHQVAVHSETGDFNAVSLAKVINTDPLNKLVVQTWFDKAATRKSTLVFCADLAHVRNLTSAFQIAGIDARYIYFGTPAVERKELVDAFKAGQFPVLVNCGQFIMHSE